MSETEIPAGVREVLLRFKLYAPDDATEEDFAAALFQAGRDHERQKIAAEIEPAWPGAAVWIRNFARGSAVPQEFADSLAPCPKCGHYRDTQNHHYGCANGEGRLAVPQNGAPE